MVEVFNRCFDHKQDLRHFALMSFFTPLPFQFFLHQMILARFVAYFGALLAVSAEVRDASFERDFALSPINKQNSPVSTNNILTRTNSHAGLDGFDARRSSPAFALRIFCQVASTTSQ